MQPASRWLDARSSWHAAELLHLAQSGQADLNDRVSGFGIAAEKTAHAASVEPDANDRQVGARTAIHSDLTPSRDVITQPRPKADTPRLHLQVSGVFPGQSAEPHPRDAIGRRNSSTLQYNAPGNRDHRKLQVAA